jgi:hypothetical protein
MSHGPLPGPFAYKYNSDLRRIPVDYVWLDRQGYIADFRLPAIAQVQSRQ